MSSAPSPRAPLAVRLWFGWAFLLLAVNGLVLGRVIEFVDFSERAPFSILGLAVMLELAAVVFGVTVALQRKRIAHRLALGIAALPVPMIAALPPVLLRFPAAAAGGWYVIFGPIGLVMSVVLIAGLLRPAARAYFSEE
ncbi:MAG: hypothetical protein M3295_10530 [Chloroflexota bacterium]|nr:hypothetical protein [Chloroflexota bacterium]